MKHICFICAPCVIDYVLTIYYKQMIVGMYWSQYEILEAKTKFSTREISYKWLWKRRRNVSTRIWVEIKEPEKKLSNRKTEPYMPPKVRASRIMGFFIAVFFFIGLTSILRKELNFLNTCHISQLRYCVVNSFFKS